MEFLRIAITGITEAPPREDRAALLQSLATSEPIAGAVWLEIENTHSLFIAAREPQRAVAIASEKLASLSDSAAAEAPTSTEQSARWLFQFAAGQQSLKARPAEALLQHAASESRQASALSPGLSFLFRSARTLSRDCNPPATPESLQKQVEQSLDILQRIYESPLKRTVLLLGTAGAVDSYAHNFARAGFVRLHAYTGAAPATPDDGSKVKLLPTLEEAVKGAEIFALVSETLPCDTTDLARLISKEAGSPATALVFTGAVSDALADQSNAFVYTPHDFGEAVSDTLGNIEELIEAEVKKFLSAVHSPHWKRFADLLTHRAEQIRLNHFQRYGKKLADDERQRFEQVVDDLLAALVHDLTHGVQDVGAGEPLQRFAQLCRLFNIDPEEEPSNE